MTTDWERYLDRWTVAGLMEADRAANIRAWELQRSPSQGLSWPIRIALAFGAILLAAGVLLFVSTHWDELSAGSRMALLVAVVGAFHACGAGTANRFAALSITMHTLGTVSLGGAIALAGQIFNLSEHWPSVILLWATGAALAWLLLRHWTQGAICAILFPWWLAGEWDIRVPAEHAIASLPVWVGFCALSLVYLGARGTGADSALRRALTWVGGLALLPTAGLLATYGTWERGEAPWQMETYWVAWVAAILTPLLIAIALDRRRAVWSAIAIIWTLLLGLVGSQPHVSIGVYFWCAMGAAGLAAWGIREARPERVNLAIAGLGITVLAFYFSNVMDKLGRSASLIGIGLLFLGGGWLLERTRRRLLSRMSREAL